MVIYRKRNGPLGYLGSLLELKEKMKLVVYSESPKNIEYVMGLFGVERYEALNIIRRKHVRDLRTSTSR